MAGTSIFSGSSFMNRMNNCLYPTGQYQNKKHLVMDEDVENIDDKVKVLYEKTKKLSMYRSGSYNESRLTDQLTKFKDAYNTLKKKYDSVSDNPTITKELNKLDSLIAENEKELKKIGIKKNSKGVLEFDSEQLQEAKQSTIDSFFEGTGSFFKLTNKIMKRIDNAVETETYSVETIKVPVYYSYNKEDINTAENILDINKSLVLLEEYDSTLQNSKNEETEQTEEGTEKPDSVTVESKCMEEMNHFCELYNKMIHVEEKEITKGTIEKIKDLTSGYYDDEDNFLKNLGFVLDEESGELCNVLVSSDPINTEVFHQLFGRDDADFSVGQYRENLEKLSLTLFQEVMKTEELGVKIDTVL